MSKKRHQARALDKPLKKNQPLSLSRGQSQAGSAWLADQAQAAFIGKWRIVQMEEWERKYLDEEGPAYVTFTDDGLGELRFLLINATVDWGYDAEIGRVEFSFEGFEEMDEVCGRGWAKLTGRGKQMVGEIAIHMGDESGFKARKIR